GTGIEGRDNAIASGAPHLRTGRSGHARDGWRRARIERRTQAERRPAGDDRHAEGGARTAAAGEADRQRKGDGEWAEDVAGEAEGERRDAHGVAASRDVRVRRRTGCADSYARR